MTLTTFEQDLKWLEDLSIQLKSYLDQLSADPSPTGERTRRITSSADEPLLIYYRPLSIDGGASHAFIGYKVDLERFAHKVIAPRLFKIKAPEGLGYMVVDHKGQIIADSGDQRLLRSESSPTLTLRPEALPFWRIIVRRDPSAVAGPALFRTAVLLGIILIAIAGLIFGGFDDC